MREAKFQLDHDGLYVDFRDESTAVSYHATHREVEITASTYSDRPALHGKVVVDLGPITVFLSREQAASLSSVLEASLEEQPAYLACAVHR